MRRSNRYTWMLNGWTTSKFLEEPWGGTEFVTIGVPDDFVAVRVGFANVNPAPWKVAKVIACASSSWSDFFNPLENEHTPRPANVWSTLTFRHGGEDRPTLVTAADAPTTVTVAGNTADPSSDDATNPSWTFTDWVSCQSVGADPATGMRVLMLRALVPSNQMVTFTNGRMFKYSDIPTLNNGYRCFTGGLKYNADFVTAPIPFSFPNLKTEILQANHLVDGQMMCLVQALTRNSGIVGLLAGDSHHSGTSTISGINNFLTQSLLKIGAGTIGTIPIGMANAAVGGLASRHIFPRMTALLNAVRPGFVILPGWSANEFIDGGNTGTSSGGNFLARMLLAADQVRDAGATPMFITPFPRDAPFMTPSALRVWLAHRDFLLGADVSREFVFDATPLLGAVANGQFTGTYLDGVSSDAIHPNDDGHAALASALTPQLRILMGLS